MNTLQNVKLENMGKQQHRQRAVQRDINTAVGTLGWRVLPTACFSVNLSLLLLV
jgi:hypothetical protein